MKVLTFIFAALLFYGCSNKESIAQLSPEEVVDVAIRLHDSTETEIKNVYKSKVKLNVTFDDTIHLGRILKRKGFTQTDWGQGNWQQGPRIMMLTLQKGNCECEVIKRYYSTEDTLFLPTESISCYLIKK
jgi:hypothetical protein